MRALSATDQDRFGRHRGLAPRPQRKIADDLYRRRVSHDIEHELSTIVLLATAVSNASDVGEDSRLRVAQIVEEARWLSSLVNIYEAEHRAVSGCEATRLDLLAAEILLPLRISSTAHITLDAVAVSTATDRLASWRALRNVILNAITAAGADGHVNVRIFAAGGTAVVEVADDGPGCDPESVRSAALGLGIVTTFAAEAGGKFRMASGQRGGCVARLELPHTS